MAGLFGDLRIAARSLARRPMFTAIAVLTLALGIGATTTVFTLVDGVLIRPLPYADSGELLSLQHEGRDGQDQLPMSTGLYVLYRDQARTLESVGLYTRTAVNLVADAQPERILGQAVTPSFFEVLGVGAVRGRTFLEEEGTPDQDPVILLSHGLWQTRFGGDASLVGRTVEVSGIQRRVVGVMPADFGHPDRDARFWIPLVIDEAEASLASFFAGGIARVADGSSIEAVRAEIGGMLGRLTDIYPSDGGAAFLMDVGIAAHVRPLKESLVGDVTATLWVLLGTVGFVLLIACANVANLLLVRAEGRHRELALRVAVGAGRRHLLRTFLGESVILAGLGGALALLIAWSSLRLTTGFLPSDLPRMAEVALDSRVLAFAAIVALGCALFFGVAPLFRYGLSSLGAELHDGGSRGGTDSAARRRLRNGLVVAQIALALVLLVGSGLMFRSFRALRAVDPGFDPAGTLTARVIVPSGEIAGWQETASFFRELGDRLADQPGVQAVGMVSGLPLTEQGVTYGGLEVEDHPRGPDELPVFAAQPRVEAAYFEAMGVEVLAGRGFRRGDGGDGERAVVVSRSFAEAWWPDASPLGRRVRVGAENEAWYDIVGVVEDVRQDGLDQPVVETVYFPTVLEFDGQYDVARSHNVILRTGEDPTLLLPILRREMRALNPRIPLADAQTVQAVFDRSTARTAFTMSLLGAASGIALLLGLVGIYGVIAYVVSQRTREIGVRMALGASAPSVRGMVVRQGLALAGAGVATGLLAAALLSRVLGSLLFGVSATDPVTYAGVATALVAVATLACWIPALRAAGVDPSIALRAE